MSFIRGSLSVLKKLTVGTRVNEPVKTQTISSDLQLTADSVKVQRIDASVAVSVILPDATSLPEGWAVEIEVIGSATVTIKTYHATTPVTLRTAITGQSYYLRLGDNNSGADAAGDWFVNLLEEADKMASERFVLTHNATTDWGTASGGRYSISVPAATHGRGTHVAVAGFYMDSGSDVVEVIPDEVVIDSSGNVTFYVTEQPEGRYAGKAILI